MQLPSLSFLPIAIVVATTPLAAEEPWRKHVLYEGAGHIRTVSVGDLTGDGIPDVVSSADGKTRLFAGPGFEETVIQESPQYSFIHSVILDVDRDGDLDIVGGQHRNPGVIAWLEQPDQPLSQRWVAHNVSRQLSGIHSLATADIDNDGRLDLLATSALTPDMSLEGGNTPYPESLIWFRIPDKPKEAKWWKPLAFADRDAPGATHYLGVGDINQDGRLDAAVGAKIGKYPEGRYFAWWEAPEDREQPWTKHQIPTEHDGASHILPVDVNQDGEMDFVATRGHSKGVFWLQGPDWNEQPIHPAVRNPHSLLIVDMDGDEDIDVATCAFGSKEAWWYENDGRGVFTKHLVATNQEAYDIRAHDLDGDGDLDFVIAGENSRNVVWYENPKR